MKLYLRNQFKPSMFGLKHKNPSDFYLCSFQRNNSALPLLLIRTILFLSSLTILSFSLAVASEDLLNYWLIYMTNWGVVLITLASFLAVVVSSYAYFGDNLEAELSTNVPMKIYWVVINIAVTIAIFITIFYYAFLWGLHSSDDPIFVAMDVLTHAINSVLMVLLLFTSRHPVRILHFFYPLAFGIIYLVFSGIYFAAGGTNMEGGAAIYPILDWTDPGATSILALIAAIAIIVIHIVVVALCALRDCATKSCRVETENHNIA